jgi:hypothetical protein
MIIGVCIHAMNNDYLLKNFFFFFFFDNYLFVNKLIEKLNIIIIIQS